MKRETRILDKFITICAGSHTATITKQEEEEEEEEEEDTHTHTHKHRDKRTWNGSEFWKLAVRSVGNRG